MNKYLINAPTARNGIITSKKREITMTKLIFAGGSATANTPMITAIRTATMDII